MRRDAEEYLQSRQNDPYMVLMNASKMMKDAMHSKGIDRYFGESAISHGRAASR
jgi:hypothetical protein